MYVVFEVVAVPDEGLTVAGLCCLEAATALDFCCRACKFNKKSSLGLLVKSSIPQINSTLRLIICLLVSQNFPLSWSA